MEYTKHMKSANSLGGKPSKSHREKAHEELLQAALARPGIRELMEVYRIWLERDQELNTYRSVTKEFPRAVTGISSSI